MAEVYVLASYCDQGKIATALALERYFKAQGKKVACLQKIKGQSDVGLYLKNGCFQYSLPLEAAKSRDALEHWLPKGFDVYIIGISTAYSPIGAAFLDLFTRYNEIIPDDWRNNWTEGISNLVKPYSKDPEILAFWEDIRRKYHQEKKIQNVITNVSAPLDSPCMDKNSVLHHPEMVVSDTFEPMMTLPRSTKKVIAVGAFPGEFWDIFPKLVWYDYDYNRFVQDLMEKKSDLAIVGECSNKNLKLPFKPKTKNVICYQPPVFLPGCQSDDRFQSGRNLQSVYTTIKEKPVGTPLQKNGFSYRDYCNRFWVFQTYSGPDIVRRDDNIVYCNGWVLPQHLIQDGLMEV
jgi:hypothetical protein